MNKNILIGLVAFGGLILVASLLTGDKDATKDASKEAVKEEVKMTAEEEAESPKEGLADPATYGVPVYPQAELRKQPQESQGVGGARHISMSLETTDAQEDIFRWYRSTLSENGWQIKSDKNVAGYQIIQAVHKNGNRTNFQVAAGENPGENIISQTVILAK